MSDTVQQREREERTRDKKRSSWVTRKPPPATEMSQTVLNPSTILPERPLKGAACNALYRTHVTNNSDTEILKAVSVRDAIERGVLEGGGDGWAGLASFFLGCLKLQQGLD